MIKEFSEIMSHYMTDTAPLIEACVYFSIGSAILLIMAFIHLLEASFKCYDSRLPRETKRKFHKICKIEGVRANKKVAQIIEEYVVNYTYHGQ